MISGPAIYRALQIGFDTAATGERGASSLRPVGQVDHLCDSQGRDNGRG